MYSWNKCCLLLALTADSNEYGTTSSPFDTAVL